MTIAAPNLHRTLRALMDQKTQRDHTPFTIYQLAKAIQMPHSILVKLMHEDPKKRVHNPRIDTLTRIVNFFKQDGFPITLDALLTEMPPHIVTFTSDKDIPPIFTKGSVFTIDTHQKPTDHSLVAVKIAPHDTLTIRKWRLNNKKRFLVSCDQLEEVPFSLKTHQVIGVVVQVNITTNPFPSTSATADSN
ncbi:MAG: hypothetical protein A3J38_10150 [Gammaproteobacteria bacterium RIFCSPHIGHO2_12_FULL_45_9]|nr:MAG: hypothetical protein A3J38_10150 [Gammaproteobacteria bacterium RIFCSPHIGHO2_12_FULL_45_9]